MSESAATLTQCNFPFLELCLNPIVLLKSQFEPIRLINFTDSSYLFLVKFHEITTQNWQRLKADASALLDVTITCGSLPCKSN